MAWAERGWAGPGRAGTDLSRFQPSATSHFD